MSHQPFRKRDAPKMTSDAAMPESLPVRKDLMNILSRMLRSYFDNTQTNQRQDIVVDYVPRRILLGGSRDNSRR
ncbi:hypothetical protein KP79_PYT18747 [Mizuhopecten yessoensis]|uniref:Uncharacterized protein n=1 Tax=Mizuhopecten yessoensis TaxID=6573 RepID=A0A210Q3M6_MIZYE|nr:hypothetical protein KP79_PYT18747 [Mizuhopecten yessoensis]